MNDALERMLYRITAFLSIGIKELPAGVDRVWANKGWDRWRVEQESPLRAWHIRQREQTIQTIRGLDGEVSIFEPGCGYGKVTWCLLSLPTVRRVVAWDINPATVGMARELLGHHRKKHRLVLSVADFKSNLPNRNDRTSEKLGTNVVVCLEVLLHLPEVSQLLRYLSHSLPPGTIVVGNLKQARGMLFQSLMEHPFKVAIGRYFKLIARIVTRRVVPATVSGHSRQRVESMLSLFRLIDIKSDELYHWFVVEVK